MNTIDRQAHPRDLANDALVDAQRMVDYFKAKSTMAYLESYSSTRDQQDSDSILVAAKRLLAFFVKLQQWQVAAEIASSTEIRVPVPQTRPVPDGAS